MIYSVSLTRFGGYDIRGCSPNYMLIAQQTLFELVGRESWWYRMLIILQGDCTYVMAQTCGTNLGKLTPFKVAVDQHRLKSPRDRTSFVGSVLVWIYGLFIELRPWGTYVSFVVRSANSMAKCQKDVTRWLTDLSYVSFAYSHGIGLWCWIHVRKGENVFAFTIFFHCLNHAGSWNILNNNGVSTCLCSFWKI